jgi:hypothetical protein
MATPINKMASFANLEYDVKTKSMRKDFVKNEKIMPQKLINRPKNFSTSNQTIPKLSTEKNKLNEKEKINPPEDKKEIPKVANSKFKVDTMKGKTTMSTGYLNVPQKIMNQNTLGRDKKDILKK